MFTQRVEVFSNMGYGTKTHYTFFEKSKSGVILLHRF